MRGGGDEACTEYALQRSQAKSGPVGYIPIPTVALKVARIAVRHYEGPYVHYDGPHVHNEGPHVHYASLHAPCEGPQVHCDGINAPYEGLHVHCGGIYAPCEGPHVHCGVPMRHARVRTSTACTPLPQLCLP